LKYDDDDDYESCQPERQRGLRCLRHRRLENWDRGFESHSGHGRTSLSLCIVLSCVGRELGLGLFPVQGVFPKFLNVNTVSDVNSKSG